MSRESTHGPSTINPHFHHIGCLPGVLGAYSVLILKWVGLTFMGMVFARNAHAHAHMHALYRSCYITLLGIVHVQEIQGPSMYS